MSILQAILIEVEMLYMLTNYGGREHGKAIDWFVGYKNDDFGKWQV